MVKCWNTKSDRYIVHKFKKQETIDLIKIFAEVVKHIFYKCIFEFKIKHEHRNRQIVIVKSFLHLFFHKVICVKQLYLLEINLLLFCCLRKALYGWKQETQVWCLFFIALLIKLSSEQLKLESDIFISKNGLLFLTICKDHSFF